MTTTTNARPYRLGLDLGTGSIGWAVIWLDDEMNTCGIDRAGSRIFGTGRKPKDQSSLAADRRMARSARRRRDRYIARRTHTMNTLVRHGLMPDDAKQRKVLEVLNPFKLRYEGLRRRLEPHELGRALYHLQQRRGFKSNRKADKGDSDAGAMKTAIREFAQDIPAGETVGSFLWTRILDGEGARARRHGEGAKVSYEFYVDRAMVEEEFEALWEAQKKHHPDLLTSEAHQELHNAIFYQRPLKAVEAGKCFFEPEKPRAPYSLESAQLFRLYQEVNALRVRDLDDDSMTARPLSREERDNAVEFLSHYRERTFDQLRNQLFGRGSQMRFTHEEGERTKILGNAVHALLSKKQAFGDLWGDMPLETRDEICTRIDALESPQDEEDLFLWLQDTHGLQGPAAEYVSRKVSLPDGHLRISAVAIQRVLPHLVDGWDATSGQALTYDKAVIAAGYRSHSQRHTSDLYDKLPYYGEVLGHYTQSVQAGGDTVNPDEAQFGRIANPTVHIGLNEVRKVVNAIVERYGRPAQMHVEVARELGQSEKMRKEASARRSANEKENALLRETLRVEFGGIKDNFANRERLRLYNELGMLNHRCVLTGIPIERSRLFFTNDYQVDHILPFSRTLDDSFANKILVHHTANQFKRERTPFEAYGDLDQWPEILERANTAFGDPRSKGKLRRFAADAMDRFEGERDFLDRQLHDTAYLSRATKEYLGSLIDPIHVSATPGRLTGKLRYAWGLNGILADGDTKNRHDHRHHAIDAVVVACTDRRMLKAVTDANRRAEALGGGEEGVKKLLRDMPMPWEGFHEQVKQVIDRIVVSHRPDHGVGGQLHEETAYSVKDMRKTAAGGFEYLTTKRQKDPKKPDYGSWEEPKWRPMVPVYRRGESQDSSLPYKAFIGGNNYCIEIVRRSNGRWVGQVITRFQANQHDYQQFMADRDVYLHQSFSGEDLVMRLINGDTIAIDEDGERRIYRLYKMNNQLTMYFAPTEEGDVAKRVSDGLLKALTPRADPLRKLSARRVFVDVLGNVLDPGFRE